MSYGVQINGCTCAAPLVLGMLATFGPDASQMPAAQGLPDR